MSKNVKNTHLNIALVCDWLTEVGGAEKVIKAVHEMYPDAPIYTSQYRPKRATWFQTADVRTGWLNILPVALKRFIPFLRQWYFSRLDLSEYDVVISITGAEAKAVKTGVNTTHISYMHAPTQYYWTLYDQYIKNPGFGVFDPLARFMLKILIRPLRKADYAAAQRPDIVIANSTYIQQEIKKHYHRDSMVIWPNVDVVSISALAKKAMPNPKARDGFIIYGRQVSWKRMDLAISAAMKNKQKLTVIGSGPEHARLCQLAADSEYITFLPRYDGIGEIVSRITQSEAFIFPSLEPFGIAPVEALAAGTPVIGLKKGGALDMIIEGENGTFFDTQTVASLARAMKNFDVKAYDSEKIIKTAEKFSEESFKQKLDNVFQKYTKNL